MASLSQLSEEDFLCSICLEVFTKPVSTPCGHNFCLDCLKGHWRYNDAVFSCPLCKEEYYPRPELRVNTFIAKMAEKVKESAPQESSGATKETGNENAVLCGMCAGEKSAAVKSCLVCFMSYCETHLEPHLRIPHLKKHNLIHAVQNLESRLCKEHDEPLEQFCEADQMFLCRSCKSSEHKRHNVVSLEDGAQTLKATLEKKTEDMDRLIEERQLKIKQIQDLVSVRRNETGKVLSDKELMMNAMVDNIKRSQVELTQVLHTKQRRLEREAEGFIRELEVEILEMRQNNLHYNKVLLNNDALILIEQFLSLTITPPPLKDWDHLPLGSDQSELQGALRNLETTIRKEIRMLCDPDLIEMKNYAAVVTLDPNTAHPYLDISEDLRQVKRGDRKKNLLDNDERFDNLCAVLAKEGISAGKLYFEVQVKNKTSWDLGVATRSINRKGEIRLSPKNGYWTIWLRNGNEFTANSSPAINRQVREVPQNVGVFLDYEKGEVRFYDVDAMAQIFSFTGCNFTEMLYPLFSPGSNGDGKNSAPLIITLIDVFAFGV